jgi:hypothetical protein
MEKYGPIRGDPVAPWRRIHESKFLLCGWLDESEHRGVKFIDVLATNPADRILGDA